MIHLTIRFLVTLTLGLLVVSLAADAQPPGRIYRIGLFHVGLDHVPASLDGLRESLKALGYEEGENLILDWHNLPDEAAAQETAKELVREGVDLIVAFEDQTARAAKDATTEIPVVFVHVTDPVAQGLVHSVAQPGENLTGFVNMSLELSTKRLELFRALVPSLRRLLVLFDPADPVTPRLLSEVREASEFLQLDLVERPVTTEVDITQVFDTLPPGNIEGVFVVSPTLQLNFSALLVRLASERRLPLATHRKEWAVRGGLFSYGLDLRAGGVGAARYIDKIFKGAKPANLPVQWIDRLELIINLKTAHALGLTIPPSVLFQADEVIR